MLYRITLASFLMVLCCASLGLSQDHPGKEAFLEAKCNGCHAVQSQGIEAVSDKMKAPDMSNAAAELPSPEWAKKFVLREEEKDGKKHRRPWKGSEEELGHIIDWLMTLETT